MVLKKGLKTTPYNVCGHTIDVVYAKKLTMDDQNCWGAYDDDTRRIMLKYGMDKYRKAEVFLHEIIHSISFIHNFELSEKAVNTLAIELVAFIRNNKLPQLKKIMK
jgi:hypothetical protein